MSTRENIRLIARTPYTTELAENQKFIDIALANQNEPSVCV